jgi:hypothetical protein
MAEVESKPLWTWRSGPKATASFERHNRTFMNISPGRLAHITAGVTDCETTSANQRNMVSTCRLITPLMQAIVAIQKKRSKSGATPYPRGASASAPPKGRKEGGQRRATRDQGGNQRGLKHPGTRPAAKTRSPAGTAASATEAPTKKT